MVRKVNILFNFTYFTFLMLFINNPFNRYMGALRWGFLLGINTRIAQDQCGKLWRLILEDILWIFQILEDGTSIFIIILIHFKVSGRDYIKGINIGAEVWFYYFHFSQTQCTCCQRKLTYAFVIKISTKRKKVQLLYSYAWIILCWGDNLDSIRQDLRKYFVPFPHTPDVFFW